MTIDKTDFTKEPLSEEYYDCVFSNCDFNNLKICNTKFEGCEFVNCNLSLTTFASAIFDSVFKDCHMLGCNLSLLNVFSGGLQFNGCNLNYANFSQLNMKGLKFHGCSIVEATFSNAKVKNSIFHDCNLERTDFGGADITMCDFETSYNFTINPNDTKLRKARFSKDQLEGLVAHLGIIIR